MAVAQVARNGFAQSNILQSACQEPHGSNPAKHRLYSELPDTAGPSSSETAAEVASWLCQQQLLSGGAFGQSTSWGPQGLQPFSLEDVSMSNSQHTRSVPKTNPQYSVQQHSPVCKDSSLACGQAASSAAQSHGTHAATTLTTNLQLQPAYSDQSGFLSAGNVMSPAAFVHNAQQMLWQQQQQMQQYQQQQLLLGYQQYSDAMHKQQQQRQKKQDDSSALTATAVVADLASSMACTGPSAQEAVTPLPNSIESTCDTVRDALGDRAFFSIRSLLLMQQETFVQQLSELHHLVRVQQMVSSELASEHHTFTQQYRTQAMTLLQSSQGAHGGKRAAVRSASGQVALAVTDMAKQPAPAVLGGERPVWADDGGAAASAALPVHAVLMRSLPCSVRAAVSAPQVQDCSALNPASYYIGRHVGMLRPVAVKAASKMKGKGISGSEAAVVATAGLTVSDGATVQRDATAAATGNSQHRQQQHLSSLMLGDNHTRQQVLTFAGQHQHGTCSTGRLSVGELDRPPFPAGADAHESSTARKAVMPRVAGDKGINRQQWQQQQAMPPPPPMRPELAAQHAAAAAASHQQQLQLHQQQEAEGQVAAAAGPAGASALNVFRPMPQIDPSFASKFLAGGQRDAAAVAAPAPQFDPHSYWMSKHYGGRSASQSMSAPSPVGAASGRKQQQDALNNTQLPPTVATQYKQQQRSYNTFVTAMADTSAHASVASGNQPVLHWWQDAAATFGDVGLLDPNAPAPGGEAQQESQGWRDGQRSADCWTLCLVCWQLHISSNQSMLYWQLLS